MEPHIGSSGKSAMFLFVCARTRVRACVRACACMCVHLADGESVARMAAVTGVGESTIIEMLAYVSSSFCVLCVCFHFVFWNLEFCAKKLNHH